MSVHCSVCRDDVQDEPYSECRICGARLCYDCTVSAWPLNRYGATCRRCAEVEIDEVNQVLAELDAVNALIPQAAREMTSDLLERSIARESGEKVA